MGALARGIRVRCWSERELEWVKGTLEGFDPVEYEHTVRYDNGKVQQQTLFTGKVWHAPH